MGFGRSMQTIIEKASKEVENIILQKIETLVGNPVSVSQVVSMMKKNELKIIENILMGVPHVREFVIINNKNKEILGFSILTKMDINDSSYTIEVLDKNRD